MAEIVYTNRCKGGGCAGDFGEPAFIPDDQELCDFCLLDRFMPSKANVRYDDCNDPMSMNPLYDRDDVVAALRAATEPRAFTDNEGDTFIRERILANGDWQGHWDWTDNPVTLKASHVGSLREAD